MEYVNPALTFLAAQTLVRDTQTPAGIVKMAFT